MRLTFAYLCRVSPSSSVSLFFLSPRSVTTADERCSVPSQSGHPSEITRSTRARVTISFLLSVWLCRRAGALPSSLSICEGHDAEIQRTNSNAYERTKVSPIRAPRNQLEKLPCNSCTLFCETADLLRFGAERKTCLSHVDAGERDFSFPSSSFYNYMRFSSYISPRSVCGIMTCSVFSALDMIRRRERK